jgi:hypothetical protein
MKLQNPLSAQQSEILNAFYLNPIVKVAYAKKERDSIANKFKQNRVIENSKELGVRCPALLAELQKSIDSGNLIQSAVASECVYAQSLADQFGLTEFYNLSHDKVVIDKHSSDFLASKGLIVRYLYRNPEGTLLLVQAGGSAAVDCALINVTDKKQFMIDFKEPGAKTTEADLPRYGEDGYLYTTEEFELKHPQFSSMVEEQLAARLNFFDHMGSNINNFSPANIQSAVNGNYFGKKSVDVICTEDVSGNLTLVPADHLHLWAKLEGEIRTAGRNSRKAWTPVRLSEAITAIGGKIAGHVVSAQASSLKERHPRGGVGVSGYKINPFFFIRIEKIQLDGSEISFPISEIEQLKPTITAKVFFDQLDAHKVANFYVQSN